MAQFYANIKGARGEATRCGNKDSGIYGHIRGWNVGAAIEIVHVDGKDVVRVYRTGGSINSSRQLIAEFTESESRVARQHEDDHAQAVRAMRSQTTERYAH